MQVENWPIHLSPPAICSQIFFFPILFTTLRSIVEEWELELKYWMENFVKRTLLLIVIHNPCNSIWATLPTNIFVWFMLLIKVVTPSQ